jgi:valyl-tRNA synthetase
MAEELSKQYNPKDTEDKWYKFWEENKLFSAKPTRDQLPYCIVIPPPNVTGILHMGHALNDTIQDILIRQQRMKGKASLWMPGTDHAGIATQNVVEKALRKEKRTRQQLGREAFVQEVGKSAEEILIPLIKNCHTTNTIFDTDDDCTPESFSVFFASVIVFSISGLINSSNCLRARSIDT